MDPDLFHAPDAGRVILTPTHYHAFVPARLPPRIHYDQRLALALSRADTALSELAGLGRHLLVTLFLIERRRLPQPLLYLSGYVEAHRQDYYDLLQRVRTDNDWNGWIHFFLQGVQETARAAADQSGQLMELREAFRARLQRKAKALELVDHLFINPFITIQQAAKLLSTTRETARQTINVLAESDILEEISGRTWGRLYLARPIFDAIQGPARQ